ncbi:hypothetical protein MASR1M36_08780 [Candidatus Cloacimonadaceae bacterium]
MSSKLKVESSEFKRMLITELQELWGVGRTAAIKKATKLEFPVLREEKPGGGYRNVYLVPIPSISSISSTDTARHRSTAAPRMPRRRGLRHH